MYGTNSVFLLWVLSCSLVVVVEGFFNSRTTALVKQIPHPDKATSRLVSPKSQDTKAATKTTEKSSPSVYIDESLIKRLELCETGTAARRILEQALFSEKTNNNSGESSGTSQPLFGSIQIPRGLSDRIISDGDLAIQTRIRNKKYGIFDLICTNGDKDADRAAAGVFTVFLASTLSAIAANENLPGPEILRFVVVWILSFAPLALVGFGIGATESLQALLVSVQRQIFPVYRQRMIQHEAGHFLLAHLLGIPIAGYSTNAVKNSVQFYPLNDKDVGKEKAEMLGFDRPTSRVDEGLLLRRREAQTSDAPFFSDDGKGSDVIATQSVFRNVKNHTDNPFLKIATDSNPKKSWPFRGFDHETVDKLCVVSVAGVCAEIISFGNAEGGIADISQLQQIFNSAEPELTDREKENRIRFAMGYTMTQLRIHLGCIDRLADVMDNGGTVAECVLAIERCSNISGNDGFCNDYEVQRRQKFKSSALGLLERFILGSTPSLDDEADMIEGVGGGARRRNTGFIQISGDDPLYISLGAAFLFLAWATSGGVSLH